MSKILSHVVPPQGRIAVVCLQRLGDLLTAAHLVDQLAKFKNVCAIELVHFDKTMDAAKLLPGINCYHDLDFARIKQLNRIHTLAPFAYLQQRIAEIQGSHGFDGVINLSSTPFACAISNALSISKTKIYGPKMDGNRSFLGTDPYSRFLNDWGTSTSLNVFAHQDLYAAAAGISPGRFGGYIQSFSGALQAEQLVSPTSLQPAPLAFHLLSSDPRKDWSSPTNLQGWRGLIHRLKSRSKREFWLFGAPHQRVYLEKIAACFPQDVRVFSCDLPTTASLLRQCAGLVSVDTVAIHLAYLLGVKTVVIQLGPAGGMAFVPGSNAVTVQPQRNCSPCENGNCDVEPLHAPHQELFVSDLAAICEAHFFSMPVPPYLQAELSKRLRVRQCDFDRNGLRFRSPPDWLQCSPTESLSDLQDDNWRTAWWNSWHCPEACHDAMLEPLFQVNDEVGAQRLHLGLESSELLGERLRDYALKRKLRMAG